MKPSAATPGTALVLEGSPYERGRAQATQAPDQVAHVRDAVAHRLAETAPALARPEVRAFIAAQHGVTARVWPAVLDEIRGIADGFGLEAETVLTYLHCSTAADLAVMAEREPEGCTALAVTGAAGGAIVAKNRDYRPEHIPIQRVMAHVDPAWGDRSILVLGSLGSPGNFSSGMNSDGLAVADTASRTTDLGPGLHRYFLLTWLLVHCRTVPEAMAAIRGTTHSGSGLLVMGDAGGAVAAVELGHSAIGFEHRSSGRVGRSNHFVTPRMAPANLRLPENAAQRANSAARYRTLLQRLDGLPERPTAEAVAVLLASHDDAHGPAFCRHGGADLSSTIAGAVWLTAERRLLHAAGTPCSAAWQSFALPGAATDQPRSRSA